MVDKFLVMIVMGSLGAGLVGGLIQKIIWDWLKERKGDNAVTGRCEDHENCIDRIEACERCNANLKSNHSALNATFESHAEHITKRLDEGRQDFMAVRKSISKIDTSIAAITAIITERSHGAEFQGGN